MTARSGGNSIRAPHKSFRNFITVNYHPWLGDITSITDTLGRAITFNYDGNANPISIMQMWNGQSHEWATFNWDTLTMQTSFSGVSVVGTANGAVIRVRGRKWA